MSAISSVVRTLLSVREVLGSIFRSVKSTTASPTVRYRCCDVSSELCCPDARPRKWIPPLVTRFGEIQYREFNEDLI